MSHVISFYSYLMARGDLERSKFLERVKVPFLYAPNLPALTEAVLSTVVLDPNNEDETVSHMMGQALIEVRKGPGTQSGEMITIGRTPKNDLCIPDKRISKFQAYFKRDGDGWLICDAGSTNGTAVDGVQLTANEPVPIESASTIVFSKSVEVQFLLPKDVYVLLQDAKRRIS